MSGKRYTERRRAAARRSGLEVLVHYRPLGHDLRCFTNLLSAIVSFALKCVRYGALSALFFGRERPDPPAA